MRSPTLLLIRMNAAETNASSAIADCTELTVVPRSWTTAEIDTFISDVSTTSTNIAIASRIERRWFPASSTGAVLTCSAVIVVSPSPCAEDCVEFLRVFLVVLDRLPEEPLLVGRVLDPARLRDDGQVAAELAGDRVEQRADLLEWHRAEALDGGRVHPVAGVRRGVPLGLEAIHGRAPLPHRELLRSVERRLLPHDHVAHEVATRPAACAFHGRVQLLVRERIEGLVGAEGVALLLEERECIEIHVCHPSPRLPRGVRSAGRPGVTGTQWGALYDGVRDARCRLAHPDVPGPR